MTDEEPDREDEDLDHEVPADLVKLHEIREWQAAAGGDGT